MINARTILALSIIGMIFISVPLYAQNEGVAPQIVNTKIIFYLCGLAAIDFYMCTFLISLIVHFGWMQGIPTYFNPLGTTSMLWIFGTFYILEHVAEKIPGVAIFWNLVHAAIKPIAVLVFLSTIYFNASYQISGFTVLSIFAIVIAISVIDAKIWIFLGAIPIVPIFVTIAEDIIIGLSVFFTIAPFAINAPKSLTPEPPKTSVTVPKNISKNNNTNSNRIANFKGTTDTSSLKKPEPPSKKVQAYKVGKVITRNDILFLRERPDQKSKEVYRMPRGLKVEVLDYDTKLSSIANGETGRWVRVRFQILNDNKLYEGWCWENYIQIEN